MKKNKLKQKISCVFGLSLILAGVLFCNTMYMSVAKALNTEPVYGNYFSSDYGTRAEVLESAEKLNEEIYSEGVTLLKNDQDALPLNENAKISLFGKNSNRIITGGSGSGAGGGGTNVPMVEALNKAGFKLNPSLINFYNDDTKSGSGRGNAPTNGNVSAGYNTGETPINMYTDDIKNTYKEYNEAAIVVISRISGEGFDLPRTMKWNGSSYGSWGSDATQTVPGARSQDDHYLQLDQNETDLLNYCGENFDKVIVLLNTGSQFECGFLDDPNHYAYNENIKAAMWIGYPGGTGLNALGKILKGQISPSGKTVDTYARDFKQDPVWKNFANNMCEVNSSLKGNQYANLPASGGNGGGGYRNNYVTYKEGIYMGYRYYETRGFDEGASAYAGDVNGTTTKDWDNWYQSQVVYPYGYGLSYTTFEQTIVESIPANDSVITKDGTIKVKVKVENTGFYAGKDVVQVYYSAPYTLGEVEKSYVVLGGFEKTSLLNPGESEQVEVTIKVRDMASYDWNDANANGFKGYELDAGAYKIMLMKNAHDVLSTVNYQLEEDAQIKTDDATEGKIENRFDDVSNYIKKYLSRSDWKGTFPTTDYKLTAEQWVIDGLTEWDNRSATADETEPYYTTTMPTTEAKNGLVLSDMIGLAYDDALWSDYMDQFTVEQMRDLARNGGYASGQNYSDLGVTRVANADGPAGFIYGAPSGTYSFWCCETVLASTWNKDLAYDKGRAMGNEALWGNGSANSRIGGWYAPAVNIHRSPFSGRNFEYYSEDGYLSGMMSANVVKGAQDKGLFAYVKHFGVNDQETNRCGLLTWASEQTMREIYFKPFELCVKVGKTMGIMSSLNRIGPTWAGGSYELLTEILRNEWGFNGSVVTDSYMGDSSGLSNADQMVRAGGNLALGGSTINYNKDTATTVTAIRKASQGILYAHANSLAMNFSSHPTLPEGINSFLGGSLKTGVMGGVYKENVARATINKELYPDAEDSEIIYSIADGSKLPTGLYLSEQGVISGTPNEETNNYRFAVKASYKEYTKTAEFIISIVNSNGSIVYQADENLTPSIIGKVYETSIATAKIYKPDASKEEIEKFPTITYELKDGSALPEGLTLAGDGKISGTPTKECKEYKFTVLASAIGYKSTQMTFVISNYYELIFQNKTLTIGKIGVDYLENVQFATCEKSVTYSLKSGSELPRGLVLTKGGYITGTPLATVTNHKFIVVANAENAQPQEVEYKITIGLVFNSIELPNAEAGKEYSTKVDTAQGAGQITYSFKEGVVCPEGLTLSADGTLSGTPTKAGVYTVTILAQSDGKETDEITLTIYVANDTAKATTTYITIAVVSGLVVLAGVATSIVIIKRKKARKTDSK